MSHTTLFYGTLLFRRLAENIQLSLQCQNKKKITLIFIIQFLCWNTGTLIISVSDKKYECSLSFLNYTSQIKILFSDFILTTFRPHISVIGYSFTSSSGLMTYFSMRFIGLFKILIGYIDKDAAILLYFSFWTLSFSYIIYWIGHISNTFRFLDLKNIEVAGL
jgi:hypothetical protein